jgi:hypothetical protein
MLNDNGKKRFLNYWRNCEKPSIWHSLPNPISHRKSFMFCDCLQLTMVMPFILKRFLTPGDINSNDLETICNHNNRRISTHQAVNTLISCWVIVADAASYCFKLELNVNDLTYLKDVLMEEYHILLKVIVFFYFFIKMFLQ